MSTDTPADSRWRTGSSNLQVGVATLGGAALLLIGLAGFVTPGGELLVFGVNAVHNVLHVLTGVAGLLAAYWAGGRWAREYNLAMGAAYAVLVLAWVAAPGAVEDLLNAGPNDAWLHLALTILFGGAGVLGLRR